MTPADLADAIVTAIGRAVADGDLDVTVPTAVTVERPKTPEHGDYASPVALQLARAARRPPRAVAETLARRLATDSELAAVDVAGPGFLNFRLADAALGEIARTVVSAGDRYGRAVRPRGVRVNLEFVSASPTGPVTLASARWAAVGDALGRILPAAGFEVGTEYYYDRRASEQALHDLADAVGADAARYWLVRSSPDSALELDPDLMARQTSDNPVFYVQYAHARISSLLRNAESLGLTAATEPVDVALLTQPREGELLRALGEFPRVIESAARLRGPHRLARYLEELAGVYYRFYDSCRVLPQGDAEPGPATGARLLLVAATRVVLANGLGLLGVSAPERM
ncbi:MULTISPECIES: DALR anticodon-binding domain-containing protein [unclassified Frankia]